MSLPPLLKSLRRQCLLPALIALQIAVACAILANALFLLYQQAAPMLIDDGIAGEELLLVDQIISRNGHWRGSEVEAGSRLLAALPGVHSVSPTLGLPMRQTMTLTFTVRSPAGITVTASGFAGERLLDTLGLRLIAGRDFLANEYTPLFKDEGKDTGSNLSPVLITSALADRLFPDGPALGQTLRSPDPKQKDAFVVVGVVEHLLRYQLGELDDGKAEYSMLTPSRITDVPLFSYAIRIDPTRRQMLHSEVERTLQRQFGELSLEGIKPMIADYAQLRAEGFKQRRAAVWLLGTVCAVVTLITALGIASLTAYWVEQRTRQIGIRRALGASRAQIRQHFLGENLLISAIGVGSGLPLALLANDLLMRYYPLPRLPLPWLLVAALALLLIGQLAVLAPARRAAAVEPAQAARSA